jgi:aspartokinase/homoserine dehydrogenase 1
VAEHLVMKFGGTSVGSAERLERVAKLCAAEHAKGRVSIVVSAMGDTTDHLLEAADHAAKGRLSEAQAIAERVVKLAKTVESDGADALGGQLIRLLEGISLVRESSPQSLDAVLSFGERLSATVVSALLRRHGLPAEFLDSREWLRTDARFGHALVDWPATQGNVDRLRERFEKSLVVTTGFIGSTDDGRTTTLGRNGSDYTSTLLGRALGAREVNVWTDVAGVYTADPNIVPEAFPLERLSYMEALELANFGAKMFHPRTMIPLIESGIPLRIRNTVLPDAAGTKVDATGNGDELKATSVTSLENLALLDVESRRISVRASFAGRVMRALEAAGVTVWMANQAAHGQALAVAVPIPQLAAAQQAIAAELSAEVARGEVEAPRVRQPVTLLTLVGEAMGQTPNVAGRFFAALGKRGINVHAIAHASSRSVSCAIDGAATIEAVRTVHAAFHFADEQVSLLIYGKGTVGGQLIEQLRAQHEKLRRECGVALKVVAIKDRAGVRYDPRGLDLATWEQTKPEAVTDAQLLERASRLPVPVLIDCTASDGMEAVYEAAFARGVHVVAANKKPLALPLARREQLMAAARSNHRAYHYETTVGASLPVIETLKDLVRTGDKVETIEGCFSGTLGYLANEVMKGEKLSKAVKQAKELGYTEPQPQDDLSGLDVARKALILARELGLQLSLEDVSVEPLIPARLLETRELEPFFAGLARYDDELEAKLGLYRRDGKVLRYLARIDAVAGKVRVAPVAVDASHPAARLRGAEAFVAFTTARYREYPLIVQGAGAGGAVTAAGVLADVLRIAQRVAPR